MKVTGNLKIKPGKMSEQTTLAEELRISQSNPLLLLGPPAPDPGWVYRDFRKMPQAMWLELLTILGEGNYHIIAANTLQLPPAPFCRAQLWISPEAQYNWAHYLKTQLQ